VQADRVEREEISFTTGVLSNSLLNCKILDSGGEKDISKKKGEGEERKIDVVERRTPETSTRRCL